MIKDVKLNIEHQQSYSQPQQQPHIQQQPQPINPVLNQTDFLKSYSVTENRQDKMAAQYNEYQQNYMTMFDKKIPDSIDFRENITEPAINNMDELIKRHMLERDEELKKYAPPPLFTNMPAQQPQNNHPNKLNIDNNSEPIQFSIEELPPMPKISQKLSETRDLENNYSTKENGSSPENRRLSTSVKWLDDENSSKIDELRKEFLDFQVKITNMFERFLIFKLIT